MSKIDSYQHECIGIVVCPSRYEIVPGNNSHRNVPLYLLKEDATSWQAKRGDLLLGGGSGESAAFRLSIPGAIFFFARLERQNSKPAAEIFHAYWGEKQTIAFCDGYAKLGWTPRDDIAVWLAEHVIAFATQTYPEIFGKWKGDAVFKRDGSICRLPTPAEKQMG